MTAAIPYGSLAGQEPDSLGPRISYRSPVVLRPAIGHPALEPGGWLAPRLPVGVVVSQWAEDVRRELATAAERAWSRRAADPFIADLPVDRAGLPPFVTDTAALVPGFEGLARYADLTVELNARLESRVDRLRNLNCTAVDVARVTAGCQSTFPTPDLAQQWELRAGGVIADRINVLVDFDSEREFSADNTINLWYQGVEDEIVRRVEVGNIQSSLPTTRFITAAIPANSFGLQADAQVGPLEFRGILAQQKGSSVRTRSFTVGDRTTQTIQRESRGLEFEVGRFFFVTDPREIPQYPAVDVLNLQTIDLSPETRPLHVRIYRLRAFTGQVETDPNLGGIEAVAVRDDSPQRVGPFVWELLLEGIDYYLDPSGAWFGLRNRISTEEYLAVSYITAAGDTVGTFPAVHRARVDTLQLIHEPRRGAEVPTFFYEMRNLYRIGGSEVSRATIDLEITVNQSEKPLDGVGTYLSRFDLSLQNDANMLDEYNRVFPRERDPNGGEPIRDLFVVFPHLRPFADSVRLEPGERNDSLYVVPTYLLSSEAPATRFRFTWQYEATGSGDRSQLSLGAIQVRPQSETIVVGGRELLRGRDYEISYDLGVVTFPNPDSLFPGPTDVEVRFEENQLFDTAPKNVLGLATTYNLGSRGRIDAIGLFQRERTVFSRPQLGFEPQAMFMGGVAADLEFRTPWVTDAIDGLPLLQTDVPSVLEINGELALSRPNPNQAEQAYIEEFEGQSSRRISLLETQFQTGSAPPGDGLDPRYLGPSGGFDPDDAVPIVWQNVVQGPNGPVEIGPEEIDTTIVLTGASQQAETLLWLTLKPDTVGGAPDPVTGDPRWFRPRTPGPRWRSITQPLDASGLGVDLSRTEFLEFWLLEDFALTARSQEAVLVIDFGAVLEDAVAFAPTELHLQNGDSTFAGLQFLGQDQLDSEKDPTTNGFNAVVDDIGIHGDLVPSLTNVTTGETVVDLPLCEQGFTASLPVFPLGSLRAQCTRRNGVVDTEDLNGDNRLDVTLGAANEDIVRYIVRVGDQSHIVRTGLTVTDIDNRTWTWRLYRVPFRQDTTEIGSPNLRQVRSLRVTMVTPDVGIEDEVTLALARMNLVGAPWLKRAETPIVGFGGSQGEPHGEVIASIISTENEDLGYTSPPDIGDEAERRGSELGFGAQQINERSLRLIARDIRLGERAEAFVRFATEADKNFLAYERLRVWARGRGAGWEEGDLEFFIKIGQDQDNFYLYRTPVRSVDWEPEVIVELDRWLALRAQIESAWLRGDPPTGGVECNADPEAYVACDGPYLVQVRDPGVSPPNLARVSEVAAGMYRRAETVAIGEAELWVDDIRLSEVVDDVGMAGAVHARLTAADFAEVDFEFVGSDDRFRLIDEDSDYQGDRATRIGSTVRVDKFLPQSWGFSIPFSVQHQRAAVDPFFVRRSDVRASALDNLREPESRATAYQIAFRRVRRGQTPAERLLLDPLSITAARQTARETTELSTADTENRRLRVEYNNRPAPRTIPGAPAFLRGFVASLPDWISGSEFGRALQSSRLRLNPQQLRVTTTLTDNVTDRAVFRVPVGLPGDTVIQPLRSVVHTWRNEFALDLRPYSSTGLRMSYITTRDLRDYGDSTSVARLLDGVDRTLLGADVGFERDRIFETNLSLAPALSSWLRPRYNHITEYVFRRDPNAGDPVRIGDDGPFRLPEAIANRRIQEIGSTLDLSRFATSVFGEGSVPARVLRGILPADVRYVLDRRSTFDRIPFDPSADYQFAFGSIEAFRFQDGTPATSAVNSGTWTAAGGTRLPLGFTLRANYRDLEATTWVRRGEGQAEIVQESTEWPSGFVSWVFTPRGGIGSLLSSITAQTQYRHVQTSNAQPVAGMGESAGVRSETDRTTLTPSVTVTWLGGVVTTARLLREEGDLVTAGNVTRTDRTDIGGTMSFSVRPPAALVNLPSDVRAELAVNASDASICLQSAGAGECATISDSRRRQVDLRLDTAFPPNMRGGASFSYVLTDQRHTSSKFSQVIFSVFLDINFLASQIR